MVNEFKRLRCCGHMMVQAYIRHGRRSITPGIEKIGLYCPRCRRFKVPKHPDFGENIKKYPALKHISRALKPYRNSVKGLYLHGSRVRGDYRENSDYDLVLISQDKIDQSLKNKLEEHSVQLECFTLKQAKKQLELEPSYLLTVLRDGVPLIGADLREKLLRKKVNDVALYVELEDSRKQLKLLKNMLRGKVDAVDKRAIFYSAVIRLRRVHEIKRIYDRKVPRLSEDFKEYYRGDFDQLFDLYRKARDLPAELNEADVPEEIKTMSQNMLKRLVKSVDIYIKDAQTRISGVLIEKLELEK